MCRRKSFRCLLARKSLKLLLGVFLCDSNSLLCVCVRAYTLWYIWVLYRRRLAMSLAFAFHPPTHNHRLDCCCFSLPHTPSPTRCCRASDDDEDSSSNIHPKKKKFLILFYLFIYFRWRIHTSIRGSSKSRFAWGEEEKRKIDFHSEVSQQKEKSLEWHLLRESDSVGGK